MVSTSFSRPWVVWGVGVLAYAVAIFQRTSLGVAAGPATARFGIGASVLSTFAVVQLITYAGLQIPVGVLVDRYGSRRMLAIGGLVMAAGQVLLAMATDPSQALVARVLVGGGDAMTFISVLRLIPSWFPPQRTPLLTQLTGLFGQLGQVGSTIPLVAALAGPGWAASYLGAAAIGVLAVIIVIVVVRNQPADRELIPHDTSLRQAGIDVRDSFLTPGTRLGLWTHLSAQFSGMAFTLLWGYPFLTIGLGYSAGLAGGLMTSMILAAALIGPVLGQLTGAYPMRRSNLIFTIVISTIAVWTAVLLWPGRAPLPVVILLIFVLAAYGPGSAVGFDFARSFNPATRLGAASGIVNMGGFTASLITIFAVGVILDLRAPDGQFGIEDFKVAFAFQYVLWAFGLVSLIRSRRLARAELRAGGATIDPLSHAIARHWRDRRDH